MRLANAARSVPPFDHRLVALIVDRDAETRGMYAELLRSASCDTEEAADGREALAKAISRPPDLIITETRLPGITGVDLCQLLRTDASTRSTPIIFVTGDARESVARRAQLRAGADAAFVKPCRPGQLIATVRILLGQSAEFRDRSRILQQKMLEQLDRSATIAAPPPRRRRSTLSRAHRRHDTTEPAIAAPALSCPLCNQPLIYRRSHIGGVSESHQEQWDYYDCQAGCGEFQHRQRTGKLRRVQ